ncbi:hypothetical protein [Chenggangzhangella methanolivorans]|uniref:hypothetical protein n=1 Tax=Chenggangzhangella methanolivorans TaxID=1437009 RepID=UPI0021BD2A2C|nr:hypothetical protein [Chenggangzhangella methanolivorans]
MVLRGPGQPFDQRPVAERQPVEPAKEAGVAQKLRVVLFAHAAEEFAGGRLLARKMRQRPLLGEGEPHQRVGQLRQQAVQRAAKIGQGAGIGLGEIGEPMGGRRSERLPSLAREALLLVRHRRGRLGEAPHRVRSLMAEIVVGLDEMEPLETIFTAEEVEDLQQLQLVVEVVLEPDLDSLEARMPANGGVARPEFGRDLLGSEPEVGGNESRADRRQTFEAAHRRHRAVMQDVAPGEDPAGDAGCLQPGDCRVAVRDDQHVVGAPLGIRIGDHQRLPTSHASFTAWKVGGAWGVFAAAASHETAS